MLFIFILLFLTHTNTTIPSKLMADKLPIFEMNLKFLIFTSPSIVETYTILQSLYTLSTLLIDIVLDNEGQIKMNLRRG